MNRFQTTLIAAALAAACGFAQAATLRVANQGDATSMDPHSLNESLQLSLTGNVYEPLVGRDKKLGLAPALATKWAQTSPTVWRFDLRRDTSFYLLGWTPGTYDAHNALSNLMATPTDKGQGQFNLGAYSNAKIDELTLKVQSETDEAKRNAMIAEAFKLHGDDIGHIPLHQQALAWAMKKNVSLVQLADNFMPFKWINVK